MAYGHAERTLAAMRLLEAETRELLSRQDQLDPEQKQRLRDVPSRLHCGCGGRRPASWALRRERARPR